MNVPYQVERLVYACVVSAALLGCGSVANEPMVASEGVASTSSAYSTANLAYAYINPDGTIDSDYSISPDGTQPTGATPSPTGTYTVTFSGVNDGAAGNVQISTDSTNARCYAQSWAIVSGTHNLKVTINCTTATGTAANLTGYAGIMVSYTSHSLFSSSWASGASGYVLTSSTSGGVVAANTYTPTGSTTVTHGGTGAYTVGLSGITATNLGVHATAVAGSGTYCTLVSWSNVAGYLQINVACFSASGSGARADSRFDLIYFPGAAAGTTNIGGHAYVTGTTVSPGYQAEYGNGYTDTISAAYDGQITQVDYGAAVLVNYETTSATLVTAYASNGDYCGTNGFAWNSTVVKVGVLCYTPDGSSYVLGGAFDVSYTAGYVY